MVRGLPPALPRYLRTSPQITHAVLLLLTATARICRGRFLKQPSKGSRCTIWLSGQPSTEAIIWWERIEPILHFSYATEWAREAQWRTSCRKRDFLSSPSASQILF